MASSPDLLAFTIELWIDQEPTLFLLLSADGAVNRGGSGKVFPVEPDVFIAQTDRPFFPEVKRLFDPSWITQPGLYALPGLAGPLHRLKLAFLCRDLPRVVVVYEYGAESGPPPAISAFVHRALDVTQAWYDEQREGVARWKAGQAKKP